MQVLESTVNPQSDDFHANAEANGDLLHLVMVNTLDFIFGLHIHIHQMLHGRI